MSRGLNCPHCKKWVDRDMCHISQICPYCGARMSELPAVQRVYYDSDDDDEDADPVQSGIDTAVLAVSIAETIFNDHDDDTFVDDDPSFQGGSGGDFGGGGADDSW